MTRRPLRPLLRVELRDARRHPWRSLLVVLLVAVPVAAVVGGGALYHVIEPTPEEQRVAAMGVADLRIEDRGSTDLTAVRAALPNDARVEELRAGRAVLRGASRRLGATWRALDPEGLARGQVLVTGGRAPAAADEVALSATLLDALGLAIGGRVELFGDDEPPVEVVVTGGVVLPEETKAALVLRAPDDALDQGAATLLVALPDPRDAAPLAARLRAEGHSASARAEHGHHDLFGPVVVLVVGGFASAEAALIIAAAFVVGLRRRQREIGLLAASGAPAPAIRAAVRASAATLAILGVALGSVGGLIAARAMHPFLDDWNGRLNGPFEWWWPHVIAALVLGVGTAVLAAALPARALTRLPVRTLLAGSRPVATPSTWWLRLGLALVVGGVLVMTVSTGRAGPVEAFGVLFGSILAALGLAAASPWVLDVLARRASSLPVAWRLAVRDAGRFRARHGPVVAAVVGGSSVCVMIAALMTTIESSLIARVPLLRDDQVLVSGAEAESVARGLAGERPGVVAAPLSALHENGEPLVVSAGDGERPLWIASGDAHTLRALGAGAGADADAGAGAHAGSAADTDSNANVNRNAEQPDRWVHLLPVGAPIHDSIERLVRERWPGLERVTVPVDQSVRAPRAFVAESTATTLGLATGPPPGHDLRPWLVRFDGLLTKEQVARAERLAAAAAATTVDAALMQRLDRRTFLRVVLAVTLLTGLLVIGVATALSSAESAADARVLHSVGAPPGLMRRHDAARAGYLALLGGVLAVPAGLLPVVGLLPAANIELELTIPWVELAVIVAGLPAVAWCGTWLVAAITAPSRGAARGHARAPP